MTYVASLTAAAAAAARIRHLSTSFSSSSSHSSQATELLLNAATSMPPVFSFNANDNHDNQPVMSPLLPPKRIFLLRHGQAVHNPRAEVAREAGCSFEEFLRLMQEDDAFDADLTALGEEQAKEAGSHNFVREALQSVDMIVSSPLSRAIRTADLVHDSHRNCKTGPKRVAIEHFREINGKLLNAKRRPRPVLETIFPHWNFSHVPHMDESWTEELEPHHECSERGYRGLLWVMQQQEKNVLLVSHGGLLKLVMNDHPRVVLVDGRKQMQQDKIRCVSERFGNCELRSFIMSVWTDKTSNDGESHKNANGDKCLEQHLPIVTLEEISMNDDIE
ncbi:hypothetical protein HJC23_010546 [Cyclotella cryptica]|uniref:Phosphoglycerate mutase n=1 Tax=Cyclotella cryptica TaxID=29204 RepID=A0ABD3QAN6_9STRA|eukprot:CCRYP_007128-RA/>CCRYP_007128-RA protein AED:0.00 eAED:0.00 QI:243/1/1/1/0/0/2/36/332